MKKILLALALIASPLLAGSAAFADGNGGIDIGIGVETGAAANSSLKTGPVFANGGIGAASCTDSFGTPIFSYSQSRRACEIMQGSMSMYDRGLLTKAEARAFGLAALKKSGVELVTPPAATVASTMSAAPAPKATTASTMSAGNAVGAIEVKGGASGFSHYITDDVTLAKYNACTPLAFPNGDVVVKAGCN